MRIAVIGAGFIGKFNVGALAALPDVEVCAIANRTTDKAEKLIAELGIECPVFSDYRKMLDEVKPDAVLIILAHHLHHQCFIDCAEAGVDIIIEKALANTYAECLDMIDAAKRCGIKATVCHTQRYNAIYVQAAEFLVENDLGRLFSINDNININYFWDGRSPWQLSMEQSGGGITLNFGVHQLDRIHYFLGQKTREFKARYIAAKEGYEVYSSYAMMGIGDEGTPYVATCTGYTGPYLSETTLVYEKGILRCNLFECGLQQKGLFFGSNEEPEFRSIPIEYAEDDMFIREFRHAVDYLSGYVDEPPITLEWAAEMVRLVESGFSQ